MHSIETTKDREQLEHDLAELARMAIDQYSPHGVFFIGFRKGEEGVLSLGKTLGEVVPQKNYMPSFLRKMADQIEQAQHSGIILPFK